MQIEKFVQGSLFGITRLCRGNNLTVGEVNIRILNNAGMFSLYNSMLHVVQQINHCNACSQGLKLLY